VLEAIAHGVPVITSTAPLLETTAGAALAFDPSRPDELAALAERALGDQALRAELREAGVRRVRARSWEDARLMLGATTYPFPSTARSMGRGCGWPRFCAARRSVSLERGHYARDSAAMPSRRWRA
jgi:Glycosyl transferases group 1